MDAVHTQLKSYAVKHNIMANMPPVMMTRESDTMFSIVRVEKHWMPVGLCCTNYMLNHSTMYHAINDLEHMWFTKDFLLRPSLHLFDLEVYCAYRWEYPRSKVASHNEQTLERATGLLRRAHCMHEVNLIYDVFYHQWCMYQVDGFSYINMIFAVADEAHQAWCRLYTQREYENDDLVIEFRKAFTKTLEGIFHRIPNRSIVVRHVVDYLMETTNK
jgi:hypothetical protein